MYPSQKKKGDPREFTLIFFCVCVPISPLPLMALPKIMTPRCLNYKEKVIFTLKSTLFWPGGFELFQNKVCSFSLFLAPVQPTLPWVALHQKSLLLSLLLERKLALALLYATMLIKSSSTTGLIMTWKEHHYSRLTSLHWCLMSFVRWIDKHRRCPNFLPAFLPISSQAPSRPNFCCRTLIRSWFRVYVWRSWWKKGTGYFYLEF